MYLVAWVAEMRQTCNSRALWLLGLINVSENLIMGIDAPS